MADHRTMHRTSVPGVYKRGRRYVTTWRDRDKQRQESFKTFAEAREAKRRREGGDRRKRPRVHFRDYAAEWIENYRGRTARGFSETTRKEYRRDLEHHVVPYFGGWRLDDIEPPDVRDWFGYLEERGVSASGIRKAKAALQALYATAKEDGKVRDNPVAGVRYVPSRDVDPPRKIEPLTIAELELLRGALAPRWRLLFALLAHSGMRIGELLGRRWGDVHLGDDAHLVVSDQVYEGERKGLKTANAYRTLPLSPAMARALAEWRNETEYPALDHPVFASDVGTPLAYSNLYNRVWRPARDAAGLEGYGAFHRLRKTLGSVIHESGARSPRQLSDWLGHADPAFTQRVYTSQLDDGLGDAKFLDELIPLEEVPTGCQHTVRETPQTDRRGAGVNPHPDSGNAEQPQTPASP